MKIIKKLKYFQDFEQKFFINLKIKINLKEILKELF